MKRIDGHGQTTNQTHDDCSAGLGATRSNELKSSSANYMMMIAGMHAHVSVGHRQRALRRDSLCRHQQRGKGGETPIATGWCSLVQARFVAGHKPFIMSSEISLSVSRCQRHQDTGFVSAFVYLHLQSGALVREQWQFAR